MDFENRFEVSEQEYLTMIQLKTAVLLACALQFGAIISNASEENRKNIYDFGLHLGLAFQIQDDILDLYGDPSKVGKQVGGDVICNKKHSFLLLQDLGQLIQNAKNWIFFLMK